jgi:hypothetical protein
MPKVSELPAASGKVDVFYGIQDGVSVKLGATTSVDVRWFGAVGDGVTDDQPAIQLAMDAAHNAKMGVIFPTGRYLVSKPVNVWSHVAELRGVGQAEIFRNEAARFNTPGDPGSGMDEDSPRNLLLVWLGAVGKINITNLFINGNNQAIDVDTWPTATIPNQTHYVDISVNGAGPYIYGPSGNTLVGAVANWEHNDGKEHGLFINNCYFRDAPGTSIAGAGVQNLVVTSCVFDGWYDHAVYGSGRGTSVGTGVGVKSDTIIVSSNIFTHTRYARDNTAVKARNFTGRYIVSGNTIHTDGPFATFDADDPTGNVANGPVSVFGNVGRCGNTFLVVRGTAGSDDASITYPFEYGDSVTCHANHVILGGTYAVAIYNPRITGQVSGNSFLFEDRGAAPDAVALWFSGAIHADQKTRPFAFNDNTVVCVGSSKLNAMWNSTTGAEWFGEIAFLNNTFVKTSAGTGDLNSPICLNLNASGNTFNYAIQTSFNFKDAGELIFHDNKMTGGYCRVIAGGASHSIADNLFAGGAYVDARGASAGSDYSIAGNTVTGATHFLRINGGTGPRSLILKGNTFRNATVVDRFADISKFTGRSVFEIKDNVFYGNGDGTKRFWVENRGDATAPNLTLFSQIFIENNACFDADLVFYAFGTGVTAYAGANMIYDLDNTMLGCTVNFGYPGANKTDIRPTVAL